ncbi:S49 family peptidase [Azospirillum brasilense]|uniref:S49 family peptidase n=1 Tax=Azospirillum brasilense TaxID=192 RepID=UPI00157B7FA8|nr:S49 family peptidase [Azospirillum brasilense]
MSLPHAHPFPYHRVAERMFNTPLLIHPGRAKIVANYLASRMGLPPVEMDADYDAAPRSKAPMPPGSIAIIPVHGTLVHRSSWMSAMSGLVSYEELTEAFTDAVTDSNVAGILFDFDTGGGEVAGCFSLVDLIYSCRGTKPIWAIANEAAYSAGYALASACDRIILPKTAGVGSVGVVSIHMDLTGADEKNGVAYTPIFAGARKLDGWSHAPLSDAALSDAQGRIDELYRLFVATAARNRDGRISAADVRDTEAGCFYGQDAVTLGLADEVGTMADALLQLAEAAAVTSRGTSAALSTNAMNEEICMASMNAADATSAVGDSAIPCPDCQNQGECEATGACKNQDAGAETEQASASGTDVVAKILSVAHARVTNDFTGLSVGIANEVAEITGAAVGLDRLVSSVSAMREAAHDAGFAAGKEMGAKEGAEKGAGDALDMAREIAARAVAAGMPGMLVDLLKPGATLDAASAVINKASVNAARASDISASHGDTDGQFTISRADAADFTKYARVREAAAVHGKLPTITD